MDYREQFGVRKGIDRDDDLFFSEEKDSFVKVKKALSLLVCIEEDRIFWGGESWVGFSIVDPAGK